MDAFVEGPARVSVVFRDSPKNLLAAEVTEMLGSITGCHDAIHLHSHPMSLTLGSPAATVESLDDYQSAFREIIEPLRDELSERGVEGGEEALSSEHVRGVEKWR